MTLATRTLHALAEEVKKANEQDEALTKMRAKTKVEQRDLRLKIGKTASVLQTEQEFAYVAEHAGLTVARLKDYVFVRKQWPDGTFPADSNYTALEELARNDDRFTLITPGMSKRDARAAKGGKVDTPSRWSPKVKADFIKEALANPEVAKAIACDQASRAAMATAQWENEREHEALNTAKRGRTPIKEATAEMKAITALDNVRYGLIKALGTVMDLDMAQDPQVAIMAAEINNAAQMLTAYTNGTTDMTDALTRLLEENS